MKPNGKIIVANREKNNLFFQRLTN